MSDENLNLVNFWGKSTSYVWKYFGFEFEVVNEKKVIDEKLAVCRICKSKLKYHGGTTNLGNHLRAIHQIESAEEQSKKRESSKQSSKKRLVLRSHYQKPKKKQWIKTLKIWFPYRFAH